MSIAQKLSEMATKFGEFSQNIVTKLNDKLGKEEQAADAAKLGGKSQADLTASNEETGAGTVTDKFVTPAGLGDTLDQLTTAFEDAIAAITGSGDGGTTWTGTLVPGSFGEQGGFATYGYEKDDRGTLTPGAVGSHTVDELTWSLGNTAEIWFYETDLTAVEWLSLKLGGQLSTSVTATLDGTDTKIVFTFSDLSSVPTSGNVAVELKYTGSLS